MKRPNHALQRTRLGVVVCNHGVPRAGSLSLGRYATWEGISLYQDWQITRWETPVSDLKSVAMVSLVDDGQLSITMEAPREDGRPRWRVTFETYPGYRNLLEQFRLELWAHLDATRQRCGKTFTVANSPWIKTLSETEGVFATYYPDITHYVMLTEDDVIEVLSPDAPTFIALGPTPANEKLVGKATVFYNSEDRDKIEATFPSLKRTDNA